MAPEIIHIKPERSDGMLASLADKAKGTRLRNFILKMTVKFPGLFSIIRRCRMFIGGGLSLKELLRERHNFFREWRNFVSLRECCVRLSLTPTILAPAANCRSLLLTIFSNGQRSKIVSLPSEGACPRIYSVVVNDGYAIPGSNLILVQDYLIFHDFLDPLRQLAPEELIGLVELNQERSEARLKTGLAVHHELAEAAHFLDGAARNYAHWITEILPRIVLFCKMEAYKNTPILVDEELPPTIWQSLALAIGPHRKVYVLSPLISVKVQRLHLISAAGYIPFGFRGSIDRAALDGKYSAGALASVRDLALEFLRGQEYNHILPKKIFIRRKSTSRCLLNQDQIEKILISQGFSVVSPEELTFLEQVRLFNEAKVIVGPTGAAFANIIFCNPTAKVTILIADNPSMPYLYWPMLASVAGTDVTYVLGRAEGDASEGVHRDFSVPKETMASFLEELCADEQ